jgi:hypothetical protein
MIALWAIYPGVETAQAQSAGQDCPEFLEALVREPGWEGRLRSPVFENLEQEAAFGERAKRALACLEAKGEALSEAEAVLQRLAEYFLIFSEGYGEPNRPSTLWRINPSESQDPALALIREGAGVPPPPGYFFVRLYRSPADMPPRLRAAFAEKEVAGVTLLSRYIAVLVVNDLRWESRGQLDHETLNVLSHELIHAYANSTLGFDAALDLPVWYREGLAIYFSGGGKSYTYMGPGWSFTRVPTSDYRVYDTAFRYLERRLGREALLERSRQSLQAADPALLYRDLGIPDDERFLQAVLEWSEARRRLEILLACLALPLSVGAVLLFFALRQPEYTCRYCQTSGRRKEFSAGVCPVCGTPVESN